MYGYGRNTQFQVPNEAVQQAARQIQEHNASERIVQVSHQQILSPRVLLKLGAMARETGAGLASNSQSTPILASQDRGFGEGYANGSIVVQRGAHEFKIGGDAAFSSIREQFSSTNVTRRLDGVRLFDGDVPPSFASEGAADGREQAVYVQDLIRLGSVTLSAGLRYDRDRLMVEDIALSPRVSGSWFVAPAGVVVHGSYDRTFETLPVENVILASSDLVDRLGGTGQQLELRPSRGHFFEAGVSKAVANRRRVDGNYFVRRAENMTDDALLLNTAVSFPIAFSRATVTGVEIAVEVPPSRHVSGSLAYSLSKGTGSFPLSGGLFLSGTAIAARRSAALRLRAEF